MDISRKSQQLPKRKTKKKALVLDGSNGEF